VTYNRARVRSLCGTIVLLALFFALQSRNVCAQAEGETSVATGSSGASSLRTFPSRSGGVPEKLWPQSGPDTAEAQTTNPEASASISGVVQDETGAAVAGAEVTLIDSNGSPGNTILSSGDGEFTFSPIPPGSYRVVVKAKDLAPFQSAEIAVAAGQLYEMPAISLQVAAANTHVTVRPTEVIAAQQVKTEEKQRIVGIVPNFYTSYIYYAAPLTTKQKYSLVSRDVFDPLQFIAAGIIAGAEQKTNRFPGYGQGFEGYGKRYAAAFGDSVTRDYLSYAVFPSLFHQDPRYFYQGSGSTGSRLLHALSFVVALRGDNGRNTPNYSFFLGSLGSAALSNLYYPRADRGAGLVFTNFGIAVAGRAGVAVLREFISKRFTTNVPGNGKP
jgi:hypothetical protein